MAAVGPEHHFHVTLRENPAQRKAAHSERRPEPDRPGPGDLLKNVLRTIDLGRHLLPAHEIKIRVRPGVVADLVAFITNATHKLGIALGARAAQKKRRFDPVGSQDVENLAGVGNGRPVIEREHHLGRIAAAHQRGAK